MPEVIDTPAILSDADWPQGILAMRSGFAGRLNVYRMMAHNPELLAAWANLRDHVVVKSRLSPRQLEIVILRCAWRLGSTYEWQHHVSRGRKAGLDDVAIARCAEDASSTGPDADALLIRAVDALLSEALLPPDLHRSLADAIGLAATLDLMATVGMYSVLGFIVKTFDVPLDADIAEELADDPLVALTPRA